MITILNIKFEPAIKDFYAYVAGALVASGTVEFTEINEMEKAKNTVAAAVAAGFGCKESDVYITIHKHYNK